MTLDPVFRSREAVRQLQEDGFLERMAGSLAAHRAAVRHIHRLLRGVIGRRYIRPDAGEGREIEFLQNHFFLVLFHSVFETLGVEPIRLDFYARLNLCIKGIVTAGDNLFDDESKTLLPLRLDDPGSRYASILELLCFDRLIQRVTDEAVGAGWLGAASAAEAHRALLDRLAEIGALEGSEEGGVEGVLGVEEMIDKVHRVRGGLLFSLAFAAPRVIEEGELLKRFMEAERAIRHLGTAFQLVDDLTDFEFDLRRKSHNILVAAAYHGAGAAARGVIERLLGGEPPWPGLVENELAASAREVLDLARTEGRRAFELLARLGFWFPPERSDALVHAIVGIEGVERMERLTH